jgi:hypothetical protein
MKSKSKWIGQIGDRIAAKAVIISSKNPGRCRIVELETSKGNLLVWRTSLLKGYIGEEVNLEATVKAHEETTLGAKLTIINRVRFLKEARKKAEKKKPAKKRVTKKTPKEEKKKPEPKKEKVEEPKKEKVEEPKIDPKIEKLKEKFEDHYEKMLKLKNLVENKFDSWSFDVDTEGWIKTLNKVNSDLVEASNIPELKKGLDKLGELVEGLYVTITNKFGAKFETTSNICVEQIRVKDFYNAKLSIQIMKALIQLWPPLRSLHETGLENNERYLKTEIEREEKRKKEEAKKEESKPSTDFIQELKEAVFTPGVKKFGARKYFIASVFDAYKDNGGHLNRDKFDSALIKANREGKIRLARADLVTAMDAKLVKRSEVIYETATFNFIVMGEKDKPTKPVKKKVKPQNYLTS